MGAVQLDAVEPAVAAARAAAANAATVSSIIALVIGRGITLTDGVGHGADAEIGWPARP